MTEPVATRTPLPLAGLIGFRVELEPDVTQAHCILDIGDVHLNRHNVLHGGIISTLLDTASGVTASLTVDDTGMTPFTTVSLNVNFLAPATHGEVRAVGRLTGGGRSLQFIDCTLRDQNGRLIATSTGVFKRVKSRAHEQENS